MKKVFLGLVLAITFILPFVTNAKELTKSFETVFPDSKRAVYYTFLNYDNSGNVDGHYILDEVIKKYNLKNELVFELEEYDDTELEEIRIETVYKADNNNVKGNSDVKISSNSFEILYGGSGNEYASPEDFYYPSFDNFGNLDGYIVFFITTSTDMSGVKPGCVMLKIDLNGNVVWQKNTDSSKVISWFIGTDSFYIKDKTGKEYLYIFDSVSKYDENGFWVGYEKMLIKKYNYNDNINEAEPIKTIESNGIAYSFNYSYDASGEIDGIILGELGIGAGVTKYDLDLNKEFTYASDNDYVFYEVITSKNEKGIYDGYIVVGNSYDDVENDDNFTGVIKKIDYSGNLVWQDTYKGSYAQNYLMTIAENYTEYGTFNGYIVLRYSTNSYSTNDEEDLEESGFVKYTYPGHKITNQASEEGDIAVNDQAYPGDIVKIKVSPRTGYSLKRIVVMTSSGREVEVSSNGTFVMPDEEVTVLALYNKVTNPNTVSACYIVLGIVFLISLGTLIVTKKKALD